MASRTVTSRSCRIPPELARSCRAEGSCVPGGRRNANADGSPSRRRISSLTRPTTAHRPGQKEGGRPMGLSPLTDLLRLTGRNAVVTGAGQGFGVAIARRLAQAGAYVVLVDRKPEGVTAVAAEIGEQGGHASALFADITNQA